MLTGWLVRVTTVTHHKPYGCPAQRVRTIRRAKWEDGGEFYVLSPNTGPQAGPCGARVSASLVPFDSVVEMLFDYARRWGHDPLANHERHTRPSMTGTGRGKRLA